MSGMLPILVLSVVLLGVIVLMAGDAEKGKRAALQIAAVVGGLLVLAAIFGVIVDRAL